MSDLTSSVPSVPDQSVAVPDQTGVPNYQQPPAPGPAWLPLPSANQLAAHELEPADGATEARSWHLLHPLSALMAQDVSAARPAKSSQPGSQPTPEPGSDLPTSVTRPRVVTPIPVGSWAPTGSLVAEPASPYLVTCINCGDIVDVEGYCLSCGVKAPTIREHFEETPAAWTGGVCDRGVRKTVNEDAMALAADASPGSFAVLVVADGVSSSLDSDRAALAGAVAARDWLLGPAGSARPDLSPALVGADESTRNQLIVDAFQSANAAVIGATAADSPNPASCTMAIGLVVGAVAVAATVGDSRVYWLPDAGPARLLSVDDSLSQQLIAEGMAREDAERSPHAHTITRWLGRDAPDATPRIVAMPLKGAAGWLMVCSDGLWNYVSGPDALESLFGGVTSQLAAPEPTELARRLVDWAKAQGGRDNITVALARLPGATPTAGPLAGEVDRTAIEQAQPASMPSSESSLSPQPAASGKD